jgi:hypothetical protein
MASTHTPIDLTVANRIARGPRQKRWLQQMLTAEGLNPTDGEYGRFSRALWRRIDAFTDDLALAGYAVQTLPLGPQGQGWTVITGYVPGAAPLLAAIYAKTCRTLLRQRPTMSHCEVLAWVEQACPEVVSVATSAAPFFLGSLEELFAAAPGIAQGRGLSATPR